MNFELLNSLARMRRDELLREAALRRLLAVARRRRPGLRARIGGAARAFGYFANTLADAFG